MNMCPTTNKISKRERLRRRNHRLRKILQPKNALMVLHELLENTSYNCTESAEPGPYKEPLFKASVVVDGIEHIGTGKNKMMAKSNAAEEAIKYLVLKKLGSSDQTASGIMNKVEGEIEDVKMDEGGEENSGTLSWQHVACFALHKLFASWDDSGIFNEKLTTGEIHQPEKKPAKKMPANAAEMNPIMLLNQMYPNARYEELSRVGNPPQVIFTYRCTIGDQVFLGRGPNKKVSKRLCAFAACNKVLGIEYPPEVYTPGS